MNAYLRFLVALIVVSAGAARAEKMPSDINFFNVTDASYAGGAVPDDMMDDTAAFNAAIAAALGLDQTVYVPCGTYNFSGPIEWRQVTGSFLWAPRVTLMGETEACVILKLDDAATGYTDAMTPKSFIETGSLNSSDGFSTTSSGAGNRSFQNNLIDLTIDCGSGNDGVRCLDYLGHNQGTVRNVTIQSGDGAGVAGLYMGRNWPGPTLIENVTVDGFDVGVDFGQFQYSTTFLDLDLKNQNVYGMELATNLAWIENFTSDNTVPAIHTTSQYAMLTLVNGDFINGDAGAYAMDLGALTKFYLRDVVTTGYASALRKGATVVAGSSIAESVSSPVLKLFNSPDAALNLPVQAVPSTFTSDPVATPTDYANVLSYGAGNGSGGELNDDTAGVQAALDSGRPIIYFPRKADGSRGLYVFENKLVIPTTTKRIILAGNSLYAGSLPVEDGCVFSVESGTASDPAVEIEYFRRGGASTNTPTLPATWFCNSSPGRKYVVRRSTSAAYRGTSTGTLFALDNILDVYLEGGHTGFLWQQDNEDDIHGPYTIDGSGTSYRVVGLKTERDFTRATVQNGASMEIIGGFGLSCVGTGGTQPDEDVFQSVDAQMSLSFMEFCQNGSSTFWPIVFARQTIGATTRTFLGSNLVNQGFSGSTRVFAPLFTGYPNTEFHARPKMTSGQNSISVPGPVESRTYELVKIDPTGANGISMDPGTWTDPRGCAGLSRAEIRLQKIGDGSLDVDVYTCSETSDGVPVGLFDPSMPSTLSSPTNCVNITASVDFDGVTADTVVYSNPLDKIIARLNNCTDDCSSIVTLQCSR